MNGAARHPPDFHILALSGGGFRGLYTATVLKHLEDSLGAPLADRFDLICGTSVGGLLALGLAARIPAADLRDMFQHNGERIFNTRSRARRLLTRWMVAKHSSRGLRAVLEERFQDLTIGDLRHRVLVPTVNCKTGRGKFFKTPHAPKFETDYRQRLVDVGLATTAAPTYFPLHRIDGDGVFADGGIVGNSPGLFGLHEARHALRVSPAATVRVLAVGTMTSDAPFRGSWWPDRGVLRWGPRLFDLVISAQERSFEAVLKQLLDTNYVHVDDSVTGDQNQGIPSLDNVSQSAIDFLMRHGAQAAERVLGDPAFAPFSTHLAERPTFFHGPHKST